MLRWMSTVERLMPELAGAGPRTRAAVTVAVVAMPAALAGEVALTASGRAAGSSALAYAVVMTVGFISMMTVLALRAAMPSSDRRVWIALTAAAGMWISGTVWESTIGHADGAAIGPADALWLAFYPLAYLAVVLRGRSTVRLARILRVDGLVSVLSVGAVAWLLVVDPIIDSARLTHAETAVNTAYVTGDLGVMGLVVGMLALHGWSAGRVGFGGGVVGPARGGRGGRWGPARGRPRSVRGGRLDLPRAARKGHLRGGLAARRPLGRRPAAHCARRVAARARRAHGPAD